MSRTSLPNRVPFFAARRTCLLILALAGFGLALSGCSSPQLGGDEECLGAADALWTAVTSKRSNLVESSAAKIEALHAAGKMPDDAFSALSAIIQSARAEKWPEARAALKKFVRGQRPAPKPPTE